MADEQNVLKWGADVTAVLAAMDAAKTAVRTAATALETDVGQVTRLFNQLAQNGDLKKFQDSIAKRAEKSQFFRDLQSDIQKTIDDLARMKQAMIEATRLPAAPKLPPVPTPTPGPNSQTPATRGGITDALGKQAVKDLNAAAAELARAVKGRYHDQNRTNPEKLAIPGGQGATGGQLYAPRDTRVKNTPGSPALTRRDLLDLARDASINSGAGRGFTGGRGPSLQGGLIGLGGQPTKQQIEDSKKAAEAARESALNATNLARHQKAMADQALREKVKQNQAYYAQRRADAEIAANKAKEAQAAKQAADAARDQARRNEDALKSARDRQKDIDKAHGEAIKQQKDMNKLAAQRKAAQEKQDAQLIRAYNQIAEEQRKAEQKAIRDAQKDQQRRNEDARKSWAQQQRDIDKAHGQAIQQQRAMDAAANKNRADAERARERAERQAQRQREAANRAAARPTGPPGDDGSFFNRLKTGYQEGRGPASNAYQIGQVFRTSFLYSSAFAIIGGIKNVLQDSLKESVNFQQAITELSVATNMSREAAAGLAETLGEEANKYGLAGSVGVRAGQRSLGVFRALDKEGLQGATARLAGDAITKQAFLSNKDTDTLTANIAAIAQAFALGAESIGRITDTTVFFEKQYGLAIGDLSESIPAIASLAKQSGFTLEETAGLAAAVQSRQAGTPAAASGLLSQILTRQGEGAVKDVFADLGIDEMGSYADSLKQLSDLLPSLNEQQRGRVAAAFGRGRSQSAAVGLLEEFPRIFGTEDKKGLAERAQVEAFNSASKQVKQRLDDIGGQLRQFSGAIKQAQTELGKTGLFAAFGALVVATREVLEGFNGSLELLNIFPGKLQAAVLAIGLLTLAARKGAIGMIAAQGTRIGQNITQSLLARTALLDDARAARGGVFGNIRNSYRANLYDNAVAGNRGARLNAARRTGGAVVAGLGAGPILAGAAVVALAAGAVKNSFDEVSKAGQKVRDSLLLASDINVTNLESVSGAIGTLRAAREERDSNRPLIADQILGRLGGSADDRRRSDVAAIDSRMNMLTVLQNFLKNQKIDPRAGGTFGDLSRESVEKGLDLLDRRGFTAAESIDLLNRALDETKRTAADAAAAFQAQTSGTAFAATIDAKIATALGSGNSLEFADDNVFDIAPGGGKIGKFNPLRIIGSELGIGTDNKATYGDIRDQIIKDGPKGLELEDFMRSQYNTAGADKVITLAEVGDIARAVTEFITAGSKDSDLANRARPQYDKAVATLEKAFRKDIESTTEGTRVGTSEEKKGKDLQTKYYQNRTNFLNLLTKNLAEADQDDFNSYQSALRTNIGILQKLIADAPKDFSTGQDLLQLKQMQKQLFESEIREANQPLQIAAASAASSAAGTRGQIDDARANLQQAQADYSYAKANRKNDPVAFRKAYQAVVAARVQIADLERQNAIAVRELALDSTNPLEIAEQQYKEAADILKQRKREFAKGGISAAEREELVALEQDKESKAANARAQKFSQGLGDVRTKLDLDLIDNDAARAYAATQRKVLEQRLKNLKEGDEGFRQAQEQLWEILAFEKSLTDQMQGQFNLGDIDIPTVYEGRRYSKSMMNGAGMVGGSAVNSNNTISLYGLTADQMQSFMSSFFSDGGGYTAAGY